MTNKNNLSEIIFHLLFYWILIPLIILYGAHYHVSFFIPEIWANVLLVFAMIFIILGCFVALKAALQYFVKSDSLPILGKTPRYLCKKGLYSRSRHPFYIGHFLIVIGIALLTTNISLLITVILYIILSILILKFVREPKFIQKFNQEYKKYKKEVPFLWDFSKGIGSEPSILKLLFYPLLRTMEKIIFPTEVEGRENIPDKEGVLFISNHLSYLDPFFICSYCHHDIHYFTTADVFRNKLMSWFLKKMGSIPVKKFEKDPGAIRKLIRHLRQNKSIGYFPEGKRTWNGKPGQFPEGIARVLKLIDVPVVPVSLCGLDSFLPRWSDSWRRTRVKIVYHEPIFVKKNWSKTYIEKMLYKLLHSPNKNFEHEIYTSRNLNQGIERLFWRCPDCGTIGAIKTKGNKKFYCQECNNLWKLTNKNMIKQLNTEKLNTKSIARWYDRIEKYPLPEFQEDKKYYPLRSGKCLLQVGKFADMTTEDKGKFTFSQEEIVFIGQSQKYQWRLKDITSISDPGNKVIQLTTTNDKHIRFKILKGSALKWRTIFKKYTSKIE